MRQQFDVPGAQLPRQKHEAGREMHPETNERTALTNDDVIAAWAVALGILFGLMAWSLL
ncbi:MAG TPA: hypothetical protein VE175_15375 [Woeseiaceae bacterium]|nr:hypothetical protein [Woeseiaceae bacterium]